MTFSYLLGSIELHKKDYVISILKEVQKRYIQSYIPSVSKVQKPLRSMSLLECNMNRTYAILKLSVAMCIILSLNTASLQIAKMLSWMQGMMENVPTNNMIVIAPVFCKNEVLRIIATNEIHCYTCNINTQRADIGSVDNNITLQ